MSDVPEGYKMSEVGVIPEEWEVKTIGDFTSSTAGGTPSTLVPEYWNGNIRWMSSGELNLKKIHEVEGRITEAGLKNSSTKIVPLKCILIGLAGQGKTRGTTAINYVELCTNQSIAAIFPNDSFIPEYLFYNIDSRYKELRNLSTGDGGRGGLNLKIIKGILVPLPTKTEQQAIASALSDVDALITALEHLITKKRNLKQGAMQQILTGKKRLLGFSGEWEVEKTKNISSITTGAKNTQDKIDDAEYPFFVRSSIVERINSYSFDGEAVLTAGDGVGTGKVFHYINGKFDFHQRVYKISDFSEKIDGYFFYLFFSNYFLKRIMAMTAKSSVDSVRMEMIAEMPIPLPQLPEQQAIAQILSDMDTEIEALEQKQAKYKAIKQGMMQELLTGKTRLV